MGIVKDATRKERPVLGFLFSWKYIDKILLFSMIVLLAVSITFVYSTSVYFALNRSVESASPYTFVFKQVIFIIMGSFCYFVMMRIPTKIYQKYWLTYTVITFLLLMIPLFFVAVNGAKRWFIIAGITVQPSEIAKLAIILMWSSQFSLKLQEFEKRWSILKQRRAPLKSYVLRIWRSWKMPVICSAIYLLFFRLQSDNGSFIISVGLMVILLLGTGIFSRKSVRFFWGIVVFMVIALSSVYIYLSSLDPALLTQIGQSNYVYGRFIAWVNPFIDYKNVGHQIANSLIAVSNGGLFGRGIGFGIQKQGFLAEGYNDFIVANIVEEIGVVGISIIYLFYIALILRGYKIAREGKGLFDRLVALGITTLFFIQVFWNSAGIIGLIPLKGLPAPLLSYGGSSLMITMVSLGILQRIHIRSVQHAQKTAKKEAQSE